MGDNLKAQETRNQSVVDRLTTGTSPPVSFWSEQQLERMVKTNSALRDRADELREARLKKRGHSCARDGDGGISLVDSAQSAGQAQLACQFSCLFGVQHSFRIF